MNKKRVIGLLVIVLLIAAIFYIVLSKYKSKTGKAINEIVINETGLNETSNETVDCNECEFSGLRCSGKNIISCSEEEGTGCRKNIIQETCTGNNKCFGNECVFNANPNRSFPSGTCFISSPFICNDFMVSVQESSVKIEIYGTGEDVNVKSVFVSNCGKQGFNDVVNKDSGNVFVLPCSLKEGKFFKENIVVEYENYPEEKGIISVSGYLIG